MPASPQSVPTYEPITVSRHLGQPLTVDTAPPHGKISLDLLASHRGYLEFHGADRLVIADQVVYRVIGYDPADSTLTLDLVEDHRPGTPAMSVQPAEESA